VNRNDRNAHQGLTSAELTILDAAIRDPQHRHSGDVAATYESIHQAYATRAATLLVHNDLLGALESAQISVAAAGLARDYEAGLVRARDRLAALNAVALDDPRGTLTYVPGRTRRVRVKGSAAPAVARSVGGQAERVANLDPAES
jgi:hypothetical protein